MTDALSYNWAAQKGLYQKSYKTTQRLARAASKAKLAAKLSMAGMAGVAAAGAVGAGAILYNRYKLGREIDAQNKSDSDAFNLRIKQIRMMRKKK